MKGTRTGLRSAWGSSRWACSDVGGRRESGQRYDSDRRRPSTMATMDTRRVRLRPESVFDSHLIGRPLLSDHTGSVHALRSDCRLQTADEVSAPQRHSRAPTRPSSTGTGRSIPTKASSFIPPPKSQCSSHSRATKSKKEKWSIAYARFSLKGWRWPATAPESPLVKYGSDDQPPAGSHRPPPQPPYEPSPVLGACRSRDA
jgi:hypothetical protein